MKIKLRILISIVFLSFTAHAQWLQKANFTGTSKAKSTAFTIGNKIYVMGGVSNSVVILNDFWEYDITTDVWTQKPNFPGPERYGATSFVINNKGYIATGGNDFGYLYDLWEFDPLTNIWAQKAGLPNGQPQNENQRCEAFSFVIGNKAYLGGGNGFVFMPNSTGNIAFYDLWEYDPILNHWTQKSDIPDFTGRNMSIAVTLNNKGYVGLGCNVGQTVNYKSFWEYDAATDTWTAKASFPNNFTVDAGAFALNSNLYLVGGVNLNPFSLSNQFYKYDPVADVWTVLLNFNGGAIAGEFAVSIGTTAFVGTGYNGSVVTRSDLWEFTSPTGVVENNLNSDKSVKVYPDPAREKISISSAKDISFIEVYDVTGKMVIKEESTFQNIYILNLKTGVYNVKLTLKDGSLMYTRFIKVD